MKAYWQSLNDRERLVLWVGLILSVCYLSYVWIYRPMADAVLARSQAYLLKTQTLVWMKQAEQAYAAQSKRERLSTPQALSCLARELSKASFKSFAYSLQQAHGEEMDLRFDAVPYNPALSFLWSINSRYAIDIKSIDVEATDTSGVVKLSVILVNVS